MGTKIFVGNLPSEATEKDLLDIFSAEDRRVTRVSIVAYPRGFAFVEMETESDASEAISALDGRNLHGCDLSVSKAGDQPRRGSGTA